MEPIGMTPEDIEDRILNVWCLYMAIETVSQAAYLMRNDYHHSECYRTYLKDCSKIIKERKVKLLEAIHKFKKKISTPHSEFLLHEHPSG